MNKNRQKSGIIVFFLIFFCFFFLFSSSLLAQEKKEKKMSFWIKGGVGMAMSQNGIIVSTRFPSTKLLFYYGNPSIQYGIEIRRKNWLIELDYSKIDYGITGYRTLIDANFDGFKDEISNFNYSSYIPVYAIKTGYLFKETERFSIVPKLGYQLQRYYCRDYEVFPDPNFFLNPPLIQKVVCLNRIGHNISLGLDFNLQILPDVRRSNTFFSILYSHGLNALSIDTLRLPVGDPFTNFKEEIVIKTISQSLFFKIGYQFRLY
jgi:hypothetical protein